MVLMEIQSIKNAPTHALEVNLETMQQKNARTPAQKEPMQIIRPGSVSKSAQKELSLKKLTTLVCCIAPTTLLVTPGPMCAKRTVLTTGNTLQIIPRGFAS